MGTSTVEWKRIPADLSSPDSLIRENGNERKIAAERLEKWYRPLRKFCRWIVEIGRNAHVLEPAYLTPLFQKGNFCQGTKHIENLAVSWKMHSAVFPCDLLGKSQKSKIKINRKLCINLSISSLLQQRFPFSSMKIERKSINISLLIFF